MPKLKPKDLTFIDLFAGCGGLSLGLEQAGFFPLYVNELNKDALETYDYLSKLYFTPHITYVLKLLYLADLYFNDTGKSINVDSIRLSVNDKLL